MMAKDRLIDEFDQCVTRLADGATIDECVQLFPLYQDELRVMLEATRIPQKAQVSYDEVRYSQTRVRVQFEKALLQSAPRSRSLPLQRVASIILLMLFVGSLLTTGIVVAAQDSLPGDTLYAVKRLSEQVQLSVTSDKDMLQETFNQRRIDETKQVIRLGREVDVRFMGVIDRIDVSSIYISELSIELSDAIKTIELMIGMRVDIFARTQPDQTVLATDIRILDFADPNTPIENRPTPIMATLEPTSTYVIEVNLTPTIIPVTREPSITGDARVRPTSEPTLIRTDVTAIDRQNTASECDIQPPDGWIRYTIQSGDTPLGIAIGTDMQLDDFLNINCHLNPRLIVIGDVVFVPFAPRFSRTATPQLRPTERPSSEPMIITPYATSAPNDVRPTVTASRQRDKSSDQREQENDNKEDNGSSR